MYHSLAAADGEIGRDAKKGGLKNGKKKHRHERAQRPGSFTHSQRAKGER